MRKIVISTVGTSLLTQQIQRGEPKEKTWYDRLRDTANLSQKEIEAKHPDVTEIIRELQARATSKLDPKNIKAIRLASAELNGIYGLYQENLKTGVTNGDTHWLIATDTGQGIATANIVKDFLLSQGLAANIYTPPQLSTASTEKFSSGIDALIIELDSIIEPERKNSNTKICFNLVGGFKSLQGYLNTIGMFYADEIIYIFEGQNSDLITIPRLPITIDYAALAPHKVQLALMDAGSVISAKDVVGIPEAMVYPPGDNELILSTWGKLVWQQCKKEMLSQELLAFPRLEYLPSFREDYNKIRDKNERLKLQETLAKVSRLLEESDGNTQAINSVDSINYTRYQGSNGIDHFRVTLSQRVSCEAVGGKLILRYYGTHDHVEGSEKLR
ncbi:MAG: hypothetical protein Fur0025_43610 [Oscillatoriaceae cyanobacterium]